MKLETKKAPKNRLDAFEAMVGDITREHADVLTQMETLRSQGKEKTVRYKELWVRKQQLLELIRTFEGYGLL